MDTFQGRPVRENELLLVLDCIVISHILAKSGPLRQAPNFHTPPIPRAVVWLADFWRGGFEEAQGGVGFGAVVVEAGVEVLEGFRVVKPQDGTSQQGKHLASAGFLARTRGVFFP
jgi:hypothetical protein